MISFNQVTLVGNLTKDVELRALTDGKYVASFGIAVNDSYKNKDGVKVETVEFINCNAFGKSAELISKYMKKGSQILVQGKIKTHTWEKEGVKQYQTRVVIDSFKFGTSPQATVTVDTPKSPSAEKIVAPDNFEYPTEDIKPEEIPFN